ncbi:MAG: iron-sulfur cluster assembly scaffold protein [Deltaproteobacteria bacterium]|nr:iron-sulfur cluster assembly scaffold protein [Deltaproteobacteria bacterium]
MDRSERREAPRTQGSFPKNDGPIDGANGHARLTGPSGETMEVWLLVRDGEIARASFVTDGSFISHAWSVAAFAAETEPVEVAAALGQKILAAVGDLPPESAHWVVLAATTLQAACRDYLARRESAGTQETTESEVPLALH